jgi:small conductance mechanosensitive channel
MEKSIDKIIETVMTYISMYGIKIIGSIVIFIIGKWIANSLTKFTKRLLVKSKVDDTLVTFVGNLTYAVLLVFVVLAALNNLGINTTSFVAILGAAGLAVGLALQGSLSNLGAGVLLIMFRPFKANDFIDAGGAMGTVEAIHIFNTILKTPDNRVVIVPNSNIISGNITNFSAKETRRIELIFGVSYSDDLKKVKQELIDIVSSDERILKDPEPMVAVHELADSSVNFVVRPWVKSADYWNVFFDLKEKVKIRFDEKGISIPFPQRDVHMSRLVEA